MCNKLVRCSGFWDFYKVLQKVVLQISKLFILTFAFVFTLGQILYGKEEP